MPKYKTPVSSRKNAFERQQGRCYYCSFPIWLKDAGAFQRTHRLSERQARLLRCTAEHLTARREGGADDPANIAAVCAYCNLQRHKRAVPPDPPAYRALVRNRLGRGRWHSSMLPGLGASARARGPDS